MLHHDKHRPAPLPDGSPLLLVVIDTEEEFDWNAPFDRQSTATRSLPALTRAQEIFDRHGIRPLYLMDYPVAADREGTAALRAAHDEGRCDIGAHLHPWVNPPHDEQVTALNSFAGNLSAPLEQRKLEVLTGEIADNFAAAPIAYRAGRYGVGPATTEALASLGYRADLSVVPETNFSFIGGPDFSALGPAPYRFGPRQGMLEIPLTVGFAGLAPGIGRWLFARAQAETHNRLLLRKIMARSGIIQRIRLTPEGISLPECIRLTKTLHRRGIRLFSYTFHSPTLMPGCTPYVSGESDLTNFLESMDGYFRFFMDTFGGRPTSIHEVLEMATGPEHA